MINFNKTYPIPRIHCKTCFAHIEHGPKGKYCDCYLPFKIIRVDNSIASEEVLQKRNIYLREEKLKRICQI